MRTVIVIPDHPHPPDPIGGIIAHTNMLSKRCIRATREETAIFIARATIGRAYLGTPFPDDELSEVVRHVEATYGAFDERPEQFHAVVAALFHLGDGYKLPLKFPSVLGRAKTTSAAARKAAKKPSKKSSSNKAKRAPAKRASSSRKSRR